VSLPVAVKEPPTFYPPDVMREGIQGIVKIECVVATSGVPEKVKVLRSLDPRLDAEAVKAIEQWRFKPGTKDGKPVAVQVEIDVSFALAKERPKVYEPGGDVVAPVPKTEVKPAYPSELMTAGVQGTVRLECIVSTDGTPKDVAVSRPLNPVLDAAAVDALKQWRFEPGRRKGEAVPVRVELEMTFSVR
jgi:protein TonB